MNDSVNLIFKFGNPSHFELISTVILKSVILTIRTGHFRESCALFQTITLHYSEGKSILSFRYFTMYLYFIRNFSLSILSSLIVVN